MVQQQSASVETLEAITDAFNAHDLDAIMEFFADDCSLDMPRGPEPWGTALHGESGRARGSGDTLRGPTRCPLR